MGGLQFLLQNESLVFKVEKSSHLSSDREVLCVKNIVLALACISFPYQLFDSNSFLSPKYLFRIKSDLHVFLIIITYQNR